MLSHHPKKDLLAIRRSNLARALRRRDPCRVTVMQTRSLDGRKGPARAHVAAYEAAWVTMRLLVVTTFGFHIPNGGPTNETIFTGSHASHNQLQGTRSVHHHKKITSRFSNSAVCSLSHPVSISLSHRLGRERKTQCNPHSN